MSISKQLLMMLAIAILATGVIFGISFLKMDKVFEETNYSNVNSLPSVLALNDAMRNAYTLRLAIWEHISQSEAKEWDRVEKNIEKANIALKASLNSMNCSFLMTKTENFSKKTMKRWTNILFF